MQLPLTSLIFAAAAIAGPGVADSHPSGTSQHVTPQEARAIAKEAYIYGLPMEDEYRVMFAYSVFKDSPAYKGPFNSILNIARVFTPDDKAFVTPNSDTPYSFAGLDLRAEPVVITVPIIDAQRYFVFQLMDLYTYNFAYIGTRATGNGGGNYMITGPGWQGTKPAGITEIIPCETSFASIVGRTQLFNPEDLDNVKKIQSQYRVQTLSSFLHEASPSAAATPTWPKPLKPEVQRTSVEFFDVLGFLLQFAPTPPSETAIRARFARIGLQPDKPFDSASLSPELKNALAEGMADGQKDIDARRAEVGSDTSKLFGTRSFLHSDYVARALGSQMGIGANSREEAIYPIYDKDADGQPLDGSTNKYTLHFAKGQFPPVNAFWSLTMYNLPDQLLVANPAKRYLINSPMLPNLHLDAGGGLTIFIQHDDPGKDKSSNWLPAPAGPFMLTLRYYLPKPELLAGTWKSPKPQRTP